MRRDVLSIAVFLCSVLLTARVSYACQCGGAQPRLLVPAGGATHPVGAPLLVAYPFSLEPFLFDASGSSVELISVARAGSADLCGLTYELWQPTDRALGAHQLLLTDGVSADAPYRLDVGPVEVDTVDGNFSIVLTREAVGPFEPLCSPSLSGATIVGQVRGTLSLPPQVAAFVQVSAEDAAFAPLRDFRSNLDSSRDPLPQEISFFVSLTEESTGCVTVDVFDWRLNSVWRKDICLEVNGEVEEVAFARFSSASFPGAPEHSPPKMYGASTGCTIAHQQRPPLQVLTSLLALLAVAILRLSRAP